jgi:hypothetical protein
MLTSLPSEWMERRLLDRGINCKELAREAHIDPQGVYRILHGLRIQSGTRSAILSALARIPLLPLLESHDAPGSLTQLRLSLDESQAA